MGNKVLWKHILDLRASWDAALLPANIHLLTQTMSMYNLHEVCRFCAQYFDPDVPGGIAFPVKVPPPMVLYDKKKRPRGVHGAIAAPAYLHRELPPDATTDNALAPFFDDRDGDGQPSAGPGAGVGYGSADLRDKGPRWTAGVPTPSLAGSLASGGGASTSTWRGGPRHARGGVTHQPFGGGEAGGEGGVVGGDSVAFADSVTGSADASSHGDAPPAAAPGAVPSATHTHTHTHAPPPRPGNLLRRTSVSGLTMEQVRAASRPYLIPI